MTHYAQKPPPEEMLRRGPNPKTVHVDRCGMTHGTAKALSCEQALHPLANGIPVCEFCAPRPSPGCWIN
ncbi:hypothetical protein GCM10010289_39540 [Streptomyces violascens]|uniref:Uncharacterized protein n=2 Tax=Streptomyces violascens TaxID=67381 RepID=A0ABQ3QXS9_9ACTN|nr:hypothetical protein GCM10010289_39540 [Streptomyces violascens]GHI42004.1 hypothetical protein Sviol_64120 [Streptomyces violascens]